MADTINGSNVNPEPTLVKIAHDVDGNPIYPITREEAVILRDGVLLSDRLDEFYSIRDVTDLITTQFNKMDSQAEKINELIGQTESITDDVLVFDDDLISTEVDTNVEAINYQELVNNSLINFSAD